MKRTSLIPQVLLVAFGLTLPVSYAAEPKTASKPTTSIPTTGRVLTAPSPSSLGQGSTTRIGTPSTGNFSSAPKSGTSLPAGSTNGRVIGPTGSGTFTPPSTGRIDPKFSQPGFVSGLPKTTDKSGSSVPKSGSIVIDPQFGRTVRPGTKLPDGKPSGGTTSKGGQQGAIGGGISIDKSGTVSRRPTPSTGNGLNGTLFNPGAKPLGSATGGNKSGGNTTIGKTADLKFVSLPSSNTGVKGANKISPQPNSFVDALKKGSLQQLAQSKSAQKFDFSKQFDLFANKKGDLARTLNLGKSLHDAGGWYKRDCGLMDPHFTQKCVPHHYCGPAYIPNYCWFPKRDVWVDWCSSYTCVPLYDPRPIVCRPCYYDPCLTPFVVYEYPVWQPLVHTCGTWVDVAPPVYADQSDVQLLAVRFVDGGHPEQELGPRYRVWVYNNSQVGISRPFDVLLYVSQTDKPTADQPQVGVRIGSLEPGEVTSVDVRLPFRAMQVATTTSNAATTAPYQFVHAITDASRELDDANKANNGAVLASKDVLPIDPALFSSDTTEVHAGATLRIAGEGLGPEPGHVIVHVAGKELPATILGWYDLGVHVQMPTLDLLNDAEAHVVLVRGDKAVANPLKITLKSGVNVSLKTQPNPNG